MARERLSIVHVTTFYPPHNFGGDGVHVQRLARALARRGHQASVIYAPAAYSLLNRHDASRRAGVGDPPDSGAPVVVHALDGCGGALEALLVQQLGHPVLNRGRLRRLLDGSAGTSPDVIHYHNISLVGGLGVLGLGRAVKLYTAHDYWLVCPTHLLFRYNREICHSRTCLRCVLRSGRPPQSWRRLQRRERLLAELDTIIFPSQMTQSVYEAQGITQPSRVLHHFLPDAYLATAESGGGRRSGAAPYYLYVGRLDAVKGVEPLIQHFAERPHLPPLYVAGDGPLGPDLGRRYGQHPSIRFLGRCTQRTLSGYYRDAHALILPSAGYEIFGQVVLEAFAHATPAIVTRVSGAKELIDASGAGFVYDSPAELDQALDRLSRDTAARDALGQQGREYARRAHGEGAYVDRYEELIRQGQQP